ncbi:MAG: sigma-70 family RNA polymerase sigma factor [Geminicoccales bacterium]
MAPSDGLEQLIFGCARGERVAIARLYRIVAPTLFAVSLRIVRRREVAEEVLQDAFVSIWRHAGSYDATHGGPMTWMASIVRNRSIDRMRRTHREVPLEEQAGLEEPADPEPDPAAHALRNADARALAGCLEELDAEQRRCILMAYYDGCSHHELALRLGAPVGTVKSRIRRGLMRLRDCLER